MKRSLLLASALIAACALAGTSSAQRSDLSSTRLSPQVLSAGLSSTLDTRLAVVAPSLRTSGDDAALAQARSQGFLVTQGKLRVIVHARPGQAAAARAAVRLAHGSVVITSGQLVEALLPPKALGQLAANRHVARVAPVPTTSTPNTMTGLQIARARIPSLSETEGASLATFAAESSVTAEASE